ncbi:unnamed protein product [Rotaria sp. Silwood2]|nr:unnamed protein product [Rotaria sp. Silwood2]CAF3321906.1 unnamed protein product [Rotaria sp. Silwood2]
MRRISEAQMKHFIPSFEQNSSKINPQNPIKNREEIPSETSKSSSSNQPVVSSMSAATNSALTTSINNNLDNNETHLLICGGPKVGKSTLINALCGCSVVKVNHTIGLDECTRTINCYKLNKIHFWDTPGIQDWSNLDINSYLNAASLHETPLCMFYCASPGSFVKLKQLDILLQECIHHRHIYCVLIVTNMYSNVNRNYILDEFKQILEKYVDRKEDIREENGIWYYGQVGLCTMVNSQEFTNEITGKQQLQKGINELILTLMKVFSGQKQLRNWLRTVENNRQFWIEKQKELCQMIQ